MTVTVTALIRLGPQSQPSTPNMQPNRLNNRTNCQPMWTVGRPNRPQSHRYCLIRKPADNQDPKFSGRVLTYPPQIIEVRPFKPFFWHHLNLIWCKVTYYRLNALVKVAYLFPPAIIHECSLNNDFCSKQLGDVLMQKKQQQNWLMFFDWLLFPIAHILLKRN